MNTMKLKYEKPFVNIVVIENDVCMMEGSIDVSVDLSDADLDDDYDMYADEAL